MGEGPVPRKDSDDVPVAGPGPWRAAEELEPRQSTPDTAADGVATAGQPASADQPREGAEPQDRLAAAEKQASDAEKRLLYMRADFANYRKRVAREMQENSEFATEGLVLELLDVVDNLERAVASMPDANISPSDAWRVGVEGTLKQLLSVLASQGVEPFESVGDPFDPKRHDALATVVASGVEPGRVIEQVRRGYAMKGKVLRPSAVKVTRGPSEPAPERDEPQTRWANGSGTLRPEENGGT